jgi:DNA repair exonuclease SbcCD ATPase subunit
MLLRISLIIAIIAGLAAGALSYIQATDKIPALIAQRDDQKKAKETEIAAHKKTSNDLKKTAAELASTQSELTETKDARDKALAKADAQGKRADDLTAKLATVTQAKEAAENDLTAYKSSGLTPEQVSKLNKTLKDANAQILAINSEKALLSRSLAKTKAELDKYLTPDNFVKLRADLHGKILVVDPKWDFVVLDVGEDQGVISDGELLVSRAGKLVAKVIVRSVQRDRCIANIIPGWKLGDPVEGDEVTPAHPAPSI